MLLCSANEENTPIAIEIEIALTGFEEDLRLDCLEHVEQILAPVLTYGAIREDRADELCEKRRAMIRHTRRLRLG